MFEKTRKWITTLSLAALAIGVLLHVAGPNLVPDAHAEDEGSGLSCLKVAWTSAEKAERDMRTLYDRGAREMVVFASGDKYIACGW